MTLRNLVATLAAGIALLLQAAGAAALGLGDVVQQSAIGEPLRVRIRLVGAESETVSGCLRLAPGTGTDLPWVRDARVALERASDGEFVVVSHPRPVYHPILMLGIEAGCGSALRREYPLLLPPGQRLAASADRPTPASAAPPQSGSTTTPDRTAAARSPSLSELARNAFPEDAAARRRFIAAARRAAPDLFPNRASLRAPLPAGAELDVAALREIAATPPPPKRRAKRNPPAAPAEAPAAAPTPPPAATTSPEPPSDRLVLFGGDPEARLKLSYQLSEPVRIAIASDEERERLRREQQLVMALDEKIMSQMELAQRIRELEALQARLLAESRRLESAPTGATAGVPPAAPASQPPAPPPGPAVASPPRDEQPDWPFWLATTGASLLVVALLALLVKRLHDDRSARRAFDAFVEEQGDEAAREGPVIDFPLDVGDAAPPENAEADDLTEAFEGGVADTAPDFVPLDWNPPPEDLSPQGPPPLADEELHDEHESAVELADIMMSFGRVQGAAQTLADFIRHNPRQGVAPWIKLLDVYKVADMRGEFDALTRQLNQTFNVKIAAWDEFDIVRLAAETLESMPHIVAKLTATWPSRECQVYLHELLRDNRDGTRQGFPIAVVDEILCLLGMLNELVGPFRPLPGEFSQPTADANSD